MLKRISYKDYLDLLDKGVITGAGYRYQPSIMELYKTDEELLYNESLGTVYWIVPRYNLGFGVSEEDLALEEILSSSPLGEMRGRIDPRIFSDQSLKAIIEYGMELEAEPFWDDQTDQRFHYLDAKIHNIELPLSSRGRYDIKRAVKMNPSLKTNVSNQLTLEEHDWVTAQFLKCHQRDNYDRGSNFYLLNWCLALQKFDLARFLTLKNQAGEIECMLGACIDHETRSRLTLHFLAKNEDHPPKSIGTYVLSEAISTLKNFTELDTVGESASPEAYHNYKLPICNFSRKLAYFHATPTPSKDTALPYYGPNGWKYKK